MFVSVRLSDTKEKRGREFHKDIKTNEDSLLWRRVRVSGERQSEKVAFKIAAAAATAFVATGVAHARRSQTENRVVEDHWRH